MTSHSRFAVSVHILAYLAFRTGAAVPSAEIAASVNTNPVVIRRLLAVLLRGRLVTVQKGARGGFTLARPPEQITLLAPYRAVEPQPDHGLRRFNPNHKCPVGAKIQAILHGVFPRAQAAMETELARVTLADVARQLHATGPTKR
ncbi:MAG: Rrf2 family transcriptional regulator [Opitutus sp.]|nr:Rrf2 family transcriptional regulator [Opitutus sp.]